jgi:hypothetical protein
MFCCSTCIDIGFLTSKTDSSDEEDDDDREKEVRVIILTNYPSISKYRNEYRNDIVIHNT